MKKQTKHTTIVKSLVVNEKGEILFVRRKWEERPDVHDKWEFPGGKLEFGEQPEHTAKRETMEESGYKVKVKALLPKLVTFSKEFPEENRQLILVCYICELISGEKSLKDHGVSEIKWFKLDQAPKEFECLPGTIDYLNVYRSLQK